jgi:tripartite-type tricarboxylate transporter receptor subunit TctC
MRILVAPLLLAASLGAAAQSYPSRTITIVVPLTPGTGADQIARILAPRLSDRLKVAVVVDNKPGASGIIGTDVVSKAAPDGYTLLFAATSHGTVPALNKKLPYDPLKSFAPVALTATNAMAFVVGSEVPAATLHEFIALARKQPGALHYSSPGNGTPQHLAMELVKQELGIDIVHVPYKGAAGATTDLIGGRVQAMIGAIQTVGGFAHAGKIRMLAVLSNERSSAFPSVPTMKELGFPDLVVDTWYGIFAPAGTPREAIARLNTEVNALLQVAQVREALAKQGLAAAPERPERLGEMLSAELVRWNRVVAAAHIEAD